MTAPIPPLNRDKLLMEILTRQNAATRELNAMFADPADFVKRHPELIGKFTDPGSTDELPKEARGVFKESDHYDRFPSELKEEARKKIGEAVNRNIPVHFFWELHRGHDEEIEIVDPDEEGHISIICKTPLDTVKLAVELSEEVTVEA